MGKLVLTRRAGESVKLTEPNGREWLLSVQPHRRVFRADCDFQGFIVRPGGSVTFAGGNVELRPHKRPDQAILAFDFPRDVTIVRTEIA